MNIRIAKESNGDWTVVDTAISAGDCFIKIYALALDHAGCTYAAESEDGTFRMMLEMREEVKEPVHD